MQKAPRAVTGDFDHATVGKQGSLHGKKLSKYCKERRIPADFSQGSDIRRCRHATPAARSRSQGAAFLKKPFFPAVIEAVLTRHYGLTALNPERG